MDGCIDDRHTGLAAFDTELDDEDGVLREKTDEHDECNLQIDVVGHTEYLSEDECTHETERYREDNRPGEDIALILCREEQVDEEQTQTEDDGCGAACTG